MKVLALDGFGDSSLVTRTAGQNQAHRLFVHGTHKAAAIKAGLSSVATPSVRHTEKAHGIDHQVRGLLAHALAQLLHLADEPAVGQKLLDVVGGLSGWRRMGNSQTQAHREDQVSEHVTHFT